MKGQEGAYFTPPPLVNLVVRLLDPEPKESVIDPACGAGRFVAAALDHVFAKIDTNPKLPMARKADVKRQWASDRLFAVDKDAVSLRLCKAYLSLLGDGRSHIYRANTIDRSDCRIRRRLANA